MDDEHPGAQPVTATLSATTTQPQNDSESPNARAADLSRTKQDAPPETDEPHGGGHIEEFLGFGLGSEEYCVPIRSVKEIIKPVEITSIPRCPQDVIGLISLRGAIVTIVNVRRRLGLPAQPMGSQARVIVFSLDAGPVGFVVDRVSEVMHVDPARLEPPPATLTEREAACVTAVLQYRDRLIGVLHIERVVTVEPSAALMSVA